MTEIGEAEHRRAVKLVQVADEHDAALTEFYRATWSPQATVEQVRSARRSAAADNPVSPGEEPPSFIYLQDGKILGYLGTIPIRIWSDNREHPAHWVKGFMVLPEYRHGPIGFLVLRKTLRNINCAMALAVLPVVVGLSVQLGYSDLGRLSNFVRILRPARVLSRLRLEEIGFAGRPAWLRRSAALGQRLGIASAAGVCLGGLTRLAIAARGRRASSFTIEMDAPDPVEMDSLWQRTRQTLAASLVRDSRYLNWRYPRERSNTYRFVAIRSNGTLKALAVVRKPRADGDPRLHGTAVATLSEWIFPLDDPAAGLAALAGVEQVAGEFGSDALLCSVTHPGAIPLLRRRGYWKLPANVHLLVRDPSNACSLPSDLSAWWITRGDSNADEVF
jgi:GNAT superfamily N-acetyltransferase